MQEILTNIISNAVKYTSPGGKITITTDELPCEREGYIEIRTVVKDTGIGISEEFLPHLFDSFTRERDTSVESDTWAAVEKLFRVPGVKMIYRMEGVYTLKPEISYREAGKEHFGLYVDADTELLAEDIMAAVPSVTSVSEKNAITNYTGMGTGETYTKYSYDVAVDWDANIENKPAALLDLVKQFGKVDGVQYALPEVTYIEIYVSSPDDFILYPVEETTAAEDAVVGDLNQDGSLDVTDAVLLGKAAAGAVELSAAQKSSADVNHDGTVDSSDTVKLMQFLVRLVDTL